VPLCSRVSENPGALVLEFPRCFQFTPNTGKVSVAIILSHYLPQSVAKGQAEPSSLDLGKIGFFNAWDDVEFNITLRNTSAAPLVLGVPALPGYLLLDPAKLDHLQLTSDPNACTEPSRLLTEPTHLLIDGAVASFSSEHELPMVYQQREGEVAVLVLPPQTHFNVRGWFVTRELDNRVIRSMLESQSSALSMVESISTMLLAPAGTGGAAAAADDEFFGPFTCSFSLRNKHNPHNPINMELRGVLTTYELRLKRLDDDSGNLVMPTLQFPPSAASSLPIARWFSIENVSDQPVTFEVLQEISPLEGLILGNRSPRSWTTGCTRLSRSTLSRVRQTRPCMWCNFAHTRASRSGSTCLSLPTFDHLLSPPHASPMRPQSILAKSSFRRRTQTQSC